ncbi:MAG: cold-shock protein [Blastopirellula sp.]|nr:MAG: cold-shock protein [Blastopirellula sp.]
MFYLLLGYLTLVAVLSLITFVMYGYDKRQAKNDGSRISEKNLHLYSFFGGWPGALAGQKFFRHKTQKTSFQIVFWVLLLVHVSIVLGTVIYLMTQPD